MLIFQPHLPHIITNSRRPLHDLSHSKIIYKCLIMHKFHCMLSSGDGRAYYRTHFTLQSKSLYNSKRRLLFFLKLQNHTLNECTNLLYKFEENPRTEFFSILLQTFVSIFSYVLNNGFQTATLTLSTCYTE